MSASSLMAIGKTAMYASYAAMQTTSHNIANANTPGYSRQQVQLATAGGQYTGSGFFGAGVDVTTVTRAYDRFLAQQAQATRSMSAADAARLDRLSQLETVFPLGSAGIGAAAGQLLNAFVDVANTPGDASARQVVLSQARELSDRLNAAAGQVTALQAGVTHDIKTSIASVNTLAQQVARLNQQIVAARPSGQAPNDLLDQRDQLIRQIGDIIGVTAIPADDGSVGLFVGGGQNLVLGTTVNALKTQPDPYDSTRIQIALDIGDGQPVPADAIAGGSIAGLLRFQNQDLVAANNLLGQLATAMAGAVNQQQAQGLDLNGNRGAPIYEAGAPRVLAAASNAGSAAPEIGIADPSAVQASEYRLSFDGSRYSLTRLADGQSPGGPYTLAQLQSTAGVAVDGFTLRLGAGSVAVGDSFLLQPVAGAAAGMRTVLNNPAGLAAASPLTASVGAGNHGTASVASLSTAAATISPTPSASISFTSDSGAYIWTLSNGDSGSGTWTAGSPIDVPGAFTLQLAGVPKSGDTVAVVPTTSWASNNDNARAFVRLGDQALVAGQSITDAYAGALADIGIRVQGAAFSARTSAATASAAETARANQAGVNLDEEAARLMQCQQSYQAAAKILQVAQSVFDTLLQTVSA